MTNPSNDDFRVPKLHEHATPEERAQCVIMRLEQFIREGRAIDAGMSFKKWQVMARTEIATAIVEAEIAQNQDETNSRRVLFVAAAAMITIGFWGTAVSFNQVEHLAAGIICASSGAVLLFVIGHWRFRKWNKRRSARERAKRLKHIENLNRRIKRLEVELVKEEESLKEVLRKRQFFMSR